MVSKVSLRREVTVSPTMVANKKVLINQSIEEIAKVTLMAKINQEQSREDTIRIANQQDMAKHVSANVTKAIVNPTTQQRSDR